jgi:hypothetical protein
VEPSLLTMKIPSPAEVLLFSFVIPHTIYILVSQCSLVIRKPHSLLLVMFRTRNDHDLNSFTYNGKATYYYCAKLSLCFTLSIVLFHYPSLIYKQIKIEGFLVNRWFSEWGPALQELIGWVKEVG